MPLNPKVVAMPIAPSYVTIRKLGVGSTSRVYLCKPRSNSSPLQVAIKVIPIKDQLQIRKERLVQEISILKKLKFHGIVEMLDFEWDDENVYLVFEFCDGGTLLDVIAKWSQGGMMSEMQCKCVMRQIVAGYAFLHSHAIVHRDLKSENILMLQFMYPQTYGGYYAKIADFGISHQQDNTQSGVSGRIGTLLYMAPEVLLEDSYDERCDLWSLGIIFYEMAVGSTPFSRFTSDYNQLIDGIASPTPPIITIPSDEAIFVSAEYKSIVKRLLVRDPNKRVEFAHLFHCDYIDVIHAPSPVSLVQGTNRIQQAVTLDEQISKRSSVTARQVQRCIDAYMDGISWWLGYIQLVTSFRLAPNSDNTSAASVQTKTKSCMDRVEALKRLKVK